MRLWVDTDVGTNPDDAVALLCARRHPDVLLVGVSTSGSDPALATRVARRILSWPILGPSQVVRGPSIVAARSHSVCSSVPVVDGRELTVEAMEWARPDVVLVIGPSTNLARLLMAGWSPPPVVLMGGTLGPVRHRGARRRVESNVGADPDAAAIVLARGRPLVVPLDVTVRMRLDDHRRSRILRAVPQLARPFAEWQDSLRAGGVPSDEIVVCLHDPLALLVATGDVAVVVEAPRLEVKPDGRLVAIDPVVAEQVVEPVDVVVDVDTEAALDRVVQLITGPPDAFSTGPVPPAR